MIDAWGALEGLKAADCAAAAHLSVSVTFAHSCHIAQKLLSPDKRTCQRYGIKSIFCVLKKQQSIGPKERNEECIVKNRTAKYIRASLFWVIRFATLLFLGAVES